MSRKAQLEFSSPLRWTHWIRAISIFFLVNTGFYLAYVFIAPQPSADPDVFLNAKFRMWHQIFGFALIGVTIFKSYLFVFAKTSKNERDSFFDFISLRVWIGQIKYYLFLAPHPQLRGIYNPLQFISYLGLYIVIFIICISGLILYTHSYHDGLGEVFSTILKPLEVMMGGLAKVRQIHHIATWAIFIFVPIHIYMAVFNSVMGKEGSIDSIISGYKFIKEDN